MDNVTHALAGCLFAAAGIAAVERRAGRQSPGFRRTAVALGVVAAELPDADLFYAGPSMPVETLGYLLHHRGHTHTVAFALLAGLLLWGLALALRRREWRSPPESRTLLGLSLAGTLSHVFLDYTNSYGVHPWWPVDNRWFYGDAVFIVEPWLWIAALGALLFLVRGLPARVFFGGLLVVILAAAWRVDMVGRGVATTLSLGTLGWLALVRRAPASRRVALGLAAFLAVEAAFFAAAGAGERAIVRDLGSPVRDVALSPFPGNPLCLNAVVVATDGATYRVSRATVATLPAVRNAAACAGVAPSSAAQSAAGSPPAVLWGPEWSAPLAELRQLAVENCEIGAALRFIRVPVWRRTSDGAIELYDARYGEGSFASIVASRVPARCPRGVPPWVPPRRDLLVADVPVATR